MPRARRYAMIFTRHAPDASRLYAATIAAYAIMTFTPADSAIYRRYLRHISDAYTYATCAIRHYAWRRCCPCLRRRHRHAPLLYFAIIHATRYVTSSITPHCSYATTIIYRHFIYVIDAA